MSTWWPGIIPRLRTCEDHSLLEIVYGERGKPRDGQEGQFWQPEPYDHLIRDEEELARQMEYVLTNPLRVGLRTWKWVGRRKTIHVPP